MLVDRSFGLGSCGLSFSHLLFFVSNQFNVPKNWPYSINGKKSLMVDIMLLVDVENEIQNKIIFFIELLKMGKSTITEIDK